MNTTEILNTLRGISDPASREICRRKVNALGIMAKVTASELTVPEAVYSASTKDLAGMSTKSELCKSGARKDWPKGGLDATTIAALATIPQERVPSKKLKARKRTKSMAASQAREVATA